MKSHELSHHALEQKRAQWSTPSASPTATAMSVASAATFSCTSLGHKFVLRKPLAKATANKCAECGCDIREHSREEVDDQQLLAVLATQDDGRASVVLPSELAVGSYKAALRVCKEDPSSSSSVVLNCAGHKLHEFLPTTRTEFDRLRAESPPRLLDLEWEDSETFDIELEDIVRALVWARECVAAGKMVVVTCAQGKSRSGALATAYVMAKFKVGVAEALTRVQASRPLVQPNPTFMKALEAYAADIHKQPAPASHAPDCQPGQATAVRE